MSGSKPSPPGGLLPATVTARGVRLPVAALRARLGGQRGLARFLGALTVREVPTPGRPAMYARVTRCAYERAREGPGGRGDGPGGGPGGRGAPAEVLYIPRAKFLGLVGKLLAPLGAPGGRFSVVGDGLARAMAAPRALSPGARAVGAPLYTYQEAAVDFLCRDGGPLGAGAAAAGAAYLSMGTGFGKTRLAAAVAARVGGPAFCVVPTKEIQQQTLAEVAKVFPGMRCAAYANPPKNSKRVPPGPATHDFVVGIVNTVRAKPPGFFEGYALVVLDEAHEYQSPSGLKVLRLAQGAPRVLGISATPAERPDGLDRVVAHYLGPPVEATDIPGFDASDVDFRGVVREVAYRNDPRYCGAVLSRAGTVNTMGTIGRLVEDPARLRAVAAEVARLYFLHERGDAELLARAGLGPRPPADASPGYPAGGVRRHGVFVFAELREYLPALRRELCGMLGGGAVYAPELEEEGPAKPAKPAKLINTVDGAPPPTDKLTKTVDGTPPPTDKTPILRGGAKEEDRAAARAARVVLTTYGYSRRGVSLVDMTATVLATPRRNGMKQILGRATRRGSDESIVRVVVDIKDVRSPLKAQSSARRKAYRKKDYPIYEVTCDHADVTRLGAEYAAPEAEKLVWAPLEGQLDEEDGPVVTLDDL